MTFRKFLSVFVLTFFVKFAFCQVYQLMPQYGYKAPRMDFDSTLTIPTVCGVPLLKSNIVRKSAIAFDTCNNRFYFYNSKTLVWDTIKGGGTIDTSNKFVNSVTKVNDSTIRVFKGSTSTDIVINPQATRLVTEVFNKTGATITKGSVIYIDGKHSNNLPSIALAVGNNEANSYKTFALVSDDIPNMNSGYIIQAGTITGLNLPTNTYTDGDIIYLSPTVSGGFTTTKPLAPNHIVKLGSIVNAHPTQGRIEIKIENGWQLDELSDVSIATVPADSVVLQFRRTDSLWHDVSITNAIGSKYIKPSDTASMLTNYAKTSVVNTKLNTSDSSTYFTKYRSDTMRTNVYSQIGQKVNISDTANMLSKYLQLTSYEWILSQGFQALGSTIKGMNLGLPNFYSVGSSAVLTSGAVRFVPYYLPQAVTITGVKFYQGLSGTYTGNNYNGVGLYSYSGGTLTLVASTTNAASFWTNTTNTWVTKAFSSTYSASAGVYYLGLMYSYSAQTTAPQLLAGSTVNNAFATFDFTNSAKIAGVSNTGLTALPSPTIAMSSINTTTNLPLIYLY